MSDRLKRLAWFAALWVASVLALGAVAYGLRLFLPADWPPPNCRKPAT